MTGMKFGGYAEYICLPEKGTIAVKPENVTCEEAASISFGGTTALHFFRKGNIQAGQKVLIYGASGAVGTAAVQLASYYGAEVTGVCSAKNSELVKSLGANHVVNYQTEGFIKKGKRYDLIFDAVGKITKNQCKEALALNGQFVSVEGQGIAKVETKDLLFLKKLMQEERIKSVIDRRYSLEQIPEAHEYVETGHKIGSVVVTFNIVKKRISLKDPLFYDIKRYSPPLIQSSRGSPTRFFPIHSLAILLEGPIAMPALASRNKRSIGPFL